jgi:hypothetical protein
MPSDPIRPAKLGKRAAALWRDMVRPTTPIDTKILIAEACRLTDRLDGYDRQLAKDPTAPVKSEARLTAMALQKILHGLSYEPRGQQRPAGDPPPANGGKTIADEIAARRAAREANPAS